MSTQSIEHRERETRQTRGIELYERGAFERVSSEVWIVENPKTRGVYTVNLEKATCSCSDFEHHGHIPEFTCKHILACGMKSEWFKRTARALAPIFREAEPA